MRHSDEKSAGQYVKDTRMTPTFFRQRTDDDTLTDILVNMCRTDALQLAAKCTSILGAGSFNDQLVLKDSSLPRDVVLRLSYYNAHTLRQIHSVLESGKAKNAADSQVRFFLQFDIVSIKNSFSLFGNHLIREDVCPHFVYMYYHRDVKHFAREVETGGMELAPSRHRNEDSFKYNNISIHERFEGSLRTKLKTISERDLCGVVFQVTYALYCLQYYLPRFRHNDTSIDNILVNSSVPDGQPLTYAVLGHRFLLPKGLTFAALTDYDLAHSPYRIQLSSKTPTLTLMNAFMVRGLYENHADQQARTLTADYNPSYDMYYFLYRLREALTKIGRHEKMRRLIAFIDAHVQRGPKRYATDIVNELVPLEVLLHASIFDVFRKHGKRQQDAAFTTRCLSMRTTCYCDEGRTYADRIAARTNLI